MLNENKISRRGLFMKLGILFNGLVATASGPYRSYGFLMSSITRGRAGAYLSWVPSRSCRPNFQKGETRLGPPSGILT